MGFENFCVALHDDYALVKDIIRRIGEECIAQAETILTFESVGHVCFQDDIAYSSGPIISHKMLRELFFPWLVDLAQLSHAHGRPLIYHTDGDATPLLPDMVACGIDCFQAIEPKSMDIVAVKQAYGDRLSLMGNLDLGYMLTRGTPQEVEENVKFLIKHIAPRRRFAARILQLHHQLRPHGKLQNHDARRTPIRSLPDKSLDAHRRVCREH